MCDGFEKIVDDTSDLSIPLGRARKPKHDFILHRHRETEKKKKKKKKKDPLEGSKTFGFLHFFRMLW